MLFNDFNDFVALQNVAGSCYLIFASNSVHRENKDRLRETPQLAKSIRGCPSVMHSFSTHNAASIEGDELKRGLPRAHREHGTILEVRSDLKTSTTLV